MQLLDMKFITLTRILPDYYDPIDRTWTKNVYLKIKVLASAVTVYGDHMVLVGSVGFDVKESGETIEGMLNSIE